MARNRKKHGNKKPTGANTIQSTNDIVRTKDTSVNTPDHAVRSHSTGVTAARTVFNTVSLKSSVKLTLVHR
jgi:hypothetical protein